MDEINLSISRIWIHMAKSREINIIIILPGCTFNILDQDTSEKMVWTGPHPLVDRLYSTRSTGSTNPIPVPRRRSLPVQRMAGGVRGARSGRWLKEEMGVYENH